MVLSCILADSYFKKKKRKRLHQNIMFVPLAHVGLAVASLPCLGCYYCLCKVVIFVGPCSCYAHEPRLESRLYALIWKSKYLLFYYSFDCCLSH